MTQTKGQLADNGLPANMKISKLEHFKLRYENFIKNRYEINMIRDLSNIYTEKHHIIPVSMGGTDEPDNIIKLTLREHYIAHLMLLMAYQNSSMYFAYLMMSRTRDNSLKINSRTYEKLKSKFRYYRSERMKGELNPMYGKGTFAGRSHTDESKQKMSRIRKIICQKENNGYYGKNHNKNTLDLLKEKSSGDNNKMYGKVVIINDKGTISVINKSEFIKGFHKTPNSGNNKPKLKLRKKVSIDGTIYNSLKEASEKFGIPSNTVTRRCNPKNKKWKNWFYIKEDNDNGSN